MVKSKSLLKRVFLFIFVLAAALNLFLFVFKQPLWVDFPESREFVIKDADKSLVILSFYNDFTKSETGEYVPLIPGKFSHQIRINKLFPSYYELARYKQDVYKKDTSDKVTTRISPSILKQSIIASKSYSLEGGVDVYSAVKMFEGVQQKSFQVIDKQKVSIDYPDDCILFIESLGGDFVEVEKESGLIFFRVGPDSQEITYRFYTSCRSL